MKIAPMKIAPIAKLGLLLLAMSSAGAVAADPNVNVSALLTKPLAGIEGKEGTMITVDLPPGADSPPHRHNASAFVYVLEGTVIMQVQGGEQVTLRPGDTFFESPSDIHTVSRNASKTAPAKLLVVLVKPVGAPITVPAR